MHITGDGGLRCTGSLVGGLELRQSGKVHGGAAPSLALRAGERVPESAPEAWACLGFLALTVTSPSLRRRITRSVIFVLGEGMLGRVLVCWLFTPQGALADTSIAWGGVKGVVMAGCKEKGTSPLQLRRSFPYRLIL